MLKRDLKQNLVLLVFTFLLIDVLTKATLIFVVAGIITVSLGIRTNKIVRNLIAVGVFASYWITYGKLIDPEVGLNFLTSIIVIKILEKDSDRDRYMIFFGLLLLLSAGTLFERTLTYVGFFTVSFLVLIQDFYSFLGRRWNLKDFLQSLIWVAPLTFFLFFFVPRLLNPIPFNQSTLAPGEIGYTPDVNISEIESLESNEAPVFQATLSRKVSQDELYWRGNTLSWNDGWNWRLMPQDREDSKLLFDSPKGAPLVHQKVRLFTTPEFFFAIDHPEVIGFGKNYFGLPGELKSLPQRRWEAVQRYEAWSLPRELPSLSQDDQRKYLQVPLKKTDKEKLRNLFPGTSFEEVSSVIRKHFRDKGFEYSLAPGKISSLADFLSTKKGFCSHYASATALLLRVNGIPARLVSGYMGGNYNRFGSFYLVSQNDAHVWVEAYHDEKWQKIDPTEWIAPDRVRLGGEAFVESVKEQGILKKSLFRMPDFLNVARLWFQQWDFHFYQWLEEMDYYGQSAWLDKLHLRREWLFSLIPLILVIFMLGYMWFLQEKNKDSLTEEQKLWKLFFRKLRKKGLNGSAVSVAETTLLLQDSDEEIKKIWTELVYMSFAGKPSKDLKKKISKL